MFISRFSKHEGGFHFKPLSRCDSAAVSVAVLPGWARQLQGAEEFQKIQFIIRCRISKER